MGKWSVIPRLDWAEHVQDFRELRVWERGHALTLAVYRLTATFPRDERYGLVAQIRRCCSSIPANIAEGCGRDSSPDFARFLQIAIGSACELEYHLLLARDLGFLDPEAHPPIASEVVELRRMLIVLRQRVRSHEHPGPIPTGRTATD